MSVRSLELIYTETDWPATEHQLQVSLDGQQLVRWTILSKYLESPFSTLLPQVSLKESGKSRADLWQLAANTAIDIAVADANLACDDLGMIAFAYCMDQQYRVH